MIGQSIENPFPIFFDTNNELLENGYIYIGDAGLNAETNPVNVYWDKNFLYPAAQPIRTIFGKPSRSGTPSAIYAKETDYSIKVLDKNNNLSFSALTISRVANDFIDYLKPLESIAELRAVDVSLISDGQFIGVYSYYTPLIGLANPYDGGGGIFVWDATSTNADNGGTIIQVTGVVAGRWKRVYDNEVNVKWFGAKGDGVTNDNTAFTKAEAASSTLFAPNGKYLIDIFYISKTNTKIYGEQLPNLDLTDNSISGGTILVGTIASSGFDNLEFRSFGLDSSAASKTEGLSIVSVENIIMKDILVIGSDENNHCCLIENANNVDVDNFVSCGGQQGFALKATNFTVNNIISYDTLTYGFTARYSPGAPCYNGFINDINCQTNLLAKSGGFILMNDQSGAAMKNIIVDGVFVDNCDNGIYITNSGNSTKATGIKFDNVKISNIAGYAFQTFGNVDDIHINNISFEDCTGTYFTNLATDTTRLTISNHKQDSATGIALVSGSGHKFYSWEKEGGGGFFGQNTSAELEYYGMDSTVVPFSNITDGSGTGTIARKVEYPKDVTITANGLLYGMRYQSDRSKKIAGTFATNDEATLFALPNLYDSVAEVTLNVLSNAGNHCAKYIICGATATKLAGDADSAAVFDVVVTGSNVKFKYVWGVTADAYVSCIYSLYGEDV